MALTSVYPNQCLMTKNKIFFFETLRSIVSDWYQTSRYQLYPHDKRLSEGPYMEDTVASFGRLLVILLGVWVREAHSVCTPCTPEGDIHCWLTGLFPWLPLQVFALFAAAKSSAGSVRECFREWFLVQRLQKKAAGRLPNNPMVCLFSQCPKSEVLCGNLAAWKYDGRYDVTEPLIKISKITLRSTVWLSAAGDVTLLCSSTLLKETI